MKTKPPKKITPKERGIALDSIARWRGFSLTEAAKDEQLLAKAGLTPSMITELVMDHAECAREEWFSKNMPDPKRTRYGDYGAWGLVREQMEAARQAALRRYNQLPADAPEVVGSTSSSSRKAPMGKDKFGCRLGSGAAAINAALTQKGQTLQSIAEQAKQTTGRTKGHLNALMEKGLVEETNKGFRLKG